MLELNNITKNYKVADTETTVLKGISMTLRNSEFVSILGPSGCGKTTMLNIIGGLDKYTSGDLIINGVSTKEYSTRDWDTYRNHTIGFVFQTYNLIPHQTVLKNVELALSIGGISRAERKQRAIDALTKVGLEDHINKKPNQLSGGQCQRVAIARALVTNPDIILADEPTGALDSETSVQIMDILKEISKDRLVLMVTHNADLAETYSTRIIRMVDGTILSDSNPVSEEEKEEQLEEIKNKQVDLPEKERKRLERKSSMSLSTSIRLSCSNLWSKKKKTLLVGFACSIGIIGISCVLSVSYGVNDYIASLEESSASINYLYIAESTATTTMMNNMVGGDGGDGGDSGSSATTLEEFPDDTTGVYLYDEEEQTLLDMIAAMTNKQNISDEYIEYIETNINGDTSDTSLVLGIDYSRDIGMNLIADTSDGYQTVDTDSFQEMFNNTDYLESQYTILAGDSIPDEYNEIALVVDTYNRISTDVVDALGIDYDDTTSSIDYDDLIGQTIRFIPNDYYYTKADYGESFIYYAADSSVYTTDEQQSNLQTAYENGIELTITAVLREDQNASTSWLDSGVAYTQALTSRIIDLNSASQIVQDQIDNPTYDVLTGSNFLELDSVTQLMYTYMGYTIATYDSNMILLGGDSSPESIMIYPKDFDSKDKIKEVLDYWNDTEVYNVFGNDTDTDGNYIADSYKVVYTDIAETIISMVSNFIDIVTTALVAFSAISLVVSSIMIAIITYESVIERTKEIGTIRSLGGRKRDVAAVFIAEACIIGLVAFVFALGITAIVDAIINTIVDNMAGMVLGIASLNWQVVTVMICLAVGLNLIASLIPSYMASKKDPVVALRTE